MECYILLSAPFEAEMLYDIDNKPNTYKKKKKPTPMGTFYSSPYKNKKKQLTLLFSEMLGNVSG